MLKRHAIQVLSGAGHTDAEVARRVGASERSVRRIVREPAVTSIDDGAERARRRIGRPSKAERFRAFVTKVVTDEPELLSLEILRRARLAGYDGGKSAMYALVASLRPPPTRPVVRFDGLPGEFSQHDFGHVDVRFVDGARRRVHFFASRLKYSRHVEVSLVVRVEPYHVARTPQPPRLQLPRELRHDVEPTRAGSLNQRRCECRLHVVLRRRGCRGRRRPRRDAS